MRAFMRSRNVMAVARRRRALAGLHVRACVRVCVNKTAGRFMLS